MLIQSYLRTFPRHATVLAVVAGKKVEARWSAGASAPPQGGDTQSSDYRDLNKLVRILAVRVLSRLPGNSGIELADLIQAGNVGLIQASRSYSPESGVHLAGYAKFRIRGEILDTVRRHTSRSAANVVVQGSTAADGSDLESLIPARPDHSPHHIMTQIERRTILDEEVNRLPDRYRAVVRLRYSKEFSLREIGDTLNVHESRACQLHRSALCRLKRALARRGVRNISPLI